MLLTPRFTGKPPREEGDKEVSTDTCISIITLLTFFTRIVAVCLQYVANVTISAAAAALSSYGSIDRSVRNHLGCRGISVSGHLEASPVVREAIHHLGSGFVSPAAQLGLSSLRSHTHGAILQHA